MTTTKPTPVTVVCPGCRKLFDAPAGVVTVCPRCGETLSVPKAKKPGEPSEPVREGRGDDPRAASTQ